jgi:hypothetical protein
MDCRCGRRHGRDLGADRGAGAGARRRCGMDCRCGRRHGRDLGADRGAGAGARGTDVDVKASVDAGGARGRRRRCGRPCGWGAREQAWMRAEARVLVRGADASGLGRACSWRKSPSRKGAPSTCLNGHARFECASPRCAARRWCKACSPTLKHCSKLVWARQTKVQYKLQRREPGRQPGWAQWRTNMWEQVSGGAPVWCRRVIKQRRPLSLVV